MGKLFDSKLIDNYNLGFQLRSNLLCMCELCFFCSNFVSKGAINHCCFRAAKMNRFHLRVQPIVCVLGRAGTPGFAGPAGRDGSNGRTGATGFTGLKGDRGNNGVPGFNGTR